MTSRSILILLILTVANIQVVSQSAAKPISPSSITDNNIYPTPPPPKLPAAGGTIVDPTFDTTIMRLTDARDGRNNQVSYSYWPSFNKDSTYLWITSDDTTYLYYFDPKNFKVISKRRLFQFLPSGVSPITEDMIWSSKTPNLLYFHDGKRLWGYNVDTSTYMPIKDFRGPLPSTRLWQMSKSDDDNVFAFTLKNSNYNVIGYIAWKRNDDSIIRKDRDTLDEVKVDKTGRYLLVKTGISGKGAIEGQVLNLQTGAIDNLTDDEPDYNPGHSDMGMGYVIGHDNWLNRVLRRDLSKPHSFISIFEWPDWTQDNHYSLLSENEDWMLISSFGKGGTEASGPFWNEVFLVATDGSKRVRHLAHHQSIVRDYEDSPRANISRDGRFAVLTSNWGMMGRRDVFIIQIPQ